MPLPSRRAHGPALAVAAAVAFLAGLAVLDGAAVRWYSDLGMAASAAVAAVALAVRGRRTTGPMRSTWTWTAAACASWFAGQVAWSWQQLAGHEALPFPSVADIGYVGALPLAAVGIFLHPGARRHARSRSALDGLLAGASTLFAAWALLRTAQPAVFDRTSLAGVLAVVHPVAYVVIAALIGFAALRWERDDAPALTPLAAAWAVLGVTSFVYGWLVLRGDYATGHAVDACYVGTFALLAVTAARPPARRPNRRRPELGRVAAVLPYLPLAVGLAAMVTGRLHLDAVLLGAMVAADAVIVVRQYLAATENQALARQLEQRVVDRTAALADSEARYQRALAGARIGSFEIDIDGGRVFWSLEAQAIHGVEPGTFAGTVEAAVSYIHPDDRDLVVDEMRTIGERDLDLRFRIVRADGTVRWVEARASVRDFGDRTLIVGGITDVSERKAAEDELDRLAHTDALTGLPNRARLLDALDGGLADGGHVVLLVTDLDGFKDVNDGLGHDVGDALLVEIAGRLRAGVRQGDLVARLGGDEFAVVLFGTDDVDDGATVAAQLLAALQRPVEVGGLRLPIGASIGIATAGGNGATAADVLRRADVAMYRAKERGRTWATFGDDVDAGRSGRLALLADLREAIDDEAIEVHYQPEIDPRTGQVVAVEALARWHHPVRGNVPPAEFIPVAEHSGLIRDLTPLVLRQALDQCRRWRAEGFDLQVAVNVSPRLLHDPELAARIDRALLEARVPPSALLVEITENAFADATAAVEQTLADLRAIGVGLSVDDFGTGYSSLAYLKRLPVVQVKIDRSFIAGLPGHADVGIVRAVLELARHLGLTVVAEGVEDEGTLEVLRDWGCTLAQGFLVAPPAPAHELTAWLASRADNTVPSPT